MKSVVYDEHDIFTKASGHHELVLLQNDDILKLLDKVRGNLNATVTVSNKVRWMTEGT